ncbi:MAG TPA: response regulator [Candidatus Limnocylindrales bacterium]
MVNENPREPLCAEWPATILVADDEPIARQLLRRTLERAGYQVVEAATGELVPQLAEYVRPDLFILDISMPGANGIEICRAIKHDRNAPHTGHTRHGFIVAGRASAGPGGRFGRVRRQAVRR